MGKKINSPQDLSLLHLGPFLDGVALSDALPLHVPPPAQQPDLGRAEQQRADPGVVVVEGHGGVYRCRRRPQGRPVHAGRGRKGRARGRRGERGRAGGHLHGGARRGGGGRRGEALAGADNVELEGPQPDLELGELGLLAEHREQRLDLRRGRGGEGERREERGGRREGGRGGGECFLALQPKKRANQEGGRSPMEAPCALSRAGCDLLLSAYSYRSLSLSLSLSRREAVAFFFPFLSLERSTEDG